MIGPSRVCNDVYVTKGAVEFLARGSKNGMQGGGLSDSSQPMIIGDEVKLYTMKL